MTFLEPFTGIVQLKAWWKSAHGHNYNAIAGTVSVIRDEVSFGFKTRGNEANWALVVQGPTRKAIVLGCQVMGVVETDLDEITSSDVFKVK